jgi:hypothetical protein
MDSFSSPSYIINPSAKKKTEEKEMRRLVSKSLSAGTLLTVVTLLALVMAPAVDAQTTGTPGKSTTIGCSTPLNLPQVVIIQNTWTLEIVQVGSVIVSLSSNDAHTIAEMQVSDIFSKKVTTFDYQVSKSNNVYSV